MRNEIIINGFLCEFQELPGECTHDCDKCKHADVYDGGGYENDKKVI